MSVIRRDETYCRRTDSQIAFFTCAVGDFPGYFEFYSKAMNELLRDWWDVDPFTLSEIGVHIEEFTRTKVSTKEVIQIAESYLKITPMPKFELSLGEVQYAFVIRKKWNFFECGWISDTDYGLMVWETTA